VFSRRVSPNGGKEGKGEGEVGKRGERVGGGGGGTHTNADGTPARFRVIGMRIEPDKVGDPVCVGVAGDDDGVVDLVIVEGGEGAVAVGLVAVLFVGDLGSVFMICDDSGGGEGEEGKDRGDRGGRLPMHRSRGGRRCRGRRTR